MGARSSSTIGDTDEGRAGVWPFLPIGIDGVVNVGQGLAILSFCVCLPLQLSTGFNGILTGSSPRADLHPLHYAHSS